MASQRSPSLLVLNESIAAGLSDAMPLMMHFLKLATNRTVLRKDLHLVAERAGLRRLQV